MSGRPRIGFIGIGIMGAAATQRLLERGWQVTVWNLEPERYALVEPQGAVVAASPAAVAAASDLLLMCVLDGPAVHNCCFGPGGLAESREGARLLVDLSTINPDTTLEMAARLAAANGMGWIDAPVSGGPQAARAGTLTMMAGGEAALLDRARPVLAELSSNLTHMGPLGAGQTAKILNQAVVGTGYVLMAEALALAEAAGLDAAKLPACLAGGHADSGVLQRVYPQMQARDFDPPRAYARQLDKDLRNVDDFARSLGLDLPLIREAIGRYHAYVEAGNRMADAASVSRLYVGDAPRKVAT
jgi:3-hydroxyisobutyrate dehydrogenase